MNKRATFSGHGDTWELKFELEKGCAGTVLELLSGDRTVLTVWRDDMLRAEIHTHWNQNSKRYGERPDFTFTLTSPSTSGKVRLCWRGFSFCLYVDDRLEDEDWPLGDPDGGEWSAMAADSVSGLELRACASFEEKPETLYEAPFQNFVLPGHNTGVGDCMPFERDGRYCLYYLLDRRGHASKQGLGAHQWAQISSADLKTWTVHPIAVGITEQWEGSICTGSLIQKDGKTYAFYAVRMSDGSPARMTYAVSNDGVHFVKSGRYFALTEPYEPVSARDPKVFLGADGLYHMLVTTSLVDGGRFGGCLAHLTSPNLIDWTQHGTQHGPFIVPGYSDQPECSDYFEWNGWYYLVFSNFAIARYRMSRSPFGPWIRPENDLLDTLESQVPKTAAFGSRRFSTGFLARRPRTYAGNAVTHELFQRPDGTLGIKQLEEILPKARQLFHPADAVLEAGQGRASAVLFESAKDFRMKATLKIGQGALAGILLTFSGGRSYRIEMDLAARMVTITRPNEDFELGSCRDLLRNVDLSGEVPIDLLVNGDILDLMLADGRGMTMRLDDNADSGTMVEAYVITGKATVSDIELQVL